MVLRSCTGRWKGAKVCEGGGGGEGRGGEGDGVKGMVFEQVNASKRMDSGVFLNISSPLAHRASSGLFAVARVKFALAHSRLLLVFLTFSTSPPD